MKPFGRTQWIIIGCAAAVIIAGAAGASLMSADVGEGCSCPTRVALFLDFLSDFGRWAIGFATGGGVVIKTADIIKNGKKP